MTGNEEASLVFIVMMFLKIVFTHLGINFGVLGQNTRFHVFRGAV
jgi:hypothetical protein